MKESQIKRLQGAVGQHIGKELKGLGGWLNGRIVEVSDEGAVVMAFEVRENLLNPMGAIHGGAIAAIMDEMLGFQLFLKSAEDAAYVSMTMNIDFLRAATLGDEIIARPEVIRIGNRTANVTCGLFNSQGKLLARGTSNFMRVL